MTDVLCVRLCVRCFTQIPSELTKMTIKFVAQALSFPNFKFLLVKLPSRDCRELSLPSIMAYTNPYAPAYMDS